MPVDGLVIVDSHAHIFPPLDEPSGYADVETHRLYLQNGMVGHPQPYRRADTGRIVDRPDMLWDLTRPGVDGMRTVGLHMAPFGRVAWEDGGAPYYLQFMPPWLERNEATAQLLIAMMDHAGVRAAVLQNDHLYGDLNAPIADAVRRFPGRFVGLIQVDETAADRDDQIARLHDGVRAGLRGLFYAPFAFFRTNFRESFDAPRFERFWSAVASLRLPTYWDLVAVPHGTKEDYVDQLTRFARWAERHPSVPCLIVQAMRSPMFVEHGRLNVPSLLTTLCLERGVLLEMTLPISYGARYEYPYQELAPIVQGLYDAVGPAHLVWGSDVPNIERYCTYRQSHAYLCHSCAFLSPADRQAILGGNLTAFFGGTR
ncbi:MAG: amidohydrolase family protein [bacterium]